MKKISKIELRDVDILSKKEMQNVVGGYYSVLPWNCAEDEEYSVFYLRCMKKETKFPKVDACLGKSVGDDCSFETGYGSYSIGRCLRFAPNYTLHCSDLR